MKRFVFSLLLLVASAAGAVAQQVQEVRPYRKATPVYEVASPELPQDRAVANKTDATITIDYLTAEERLRGKGSTWSRQASIMNPFFFSTGDLDQSTSDPSQLLGWAAAGMIFSPFLTADSTLYTIPANYIIKDFSFRMRHVYNRTDAGFDSIFVRIYPRTIDGRDTLVDLNTVIREEVLLRDQGTHDVIVASRGAGGAFSYYTATSTITVPINQNMTVNQSADLGFYVGLFFKGAPEDTMMILSHAYPRYATTPDPSSSTPPAILSPDSAEFTKLPNSTVYIAAYNAADTAFLGYYNPVLISKLFPAAGFPSQQWKFTAKIITDSTTSTSENFDGTVAVGEPFPNPAASASQVVLPFQTTVAQPVNILVYNTVGQQIRAYNYDKMMAGNHRLNISTDGFAPGIYFIRLQSPGLDVTKRILVR